MHYVLEKGAILIIYGQVGDFSNQLEDFQSIVI